MTKPLATTIIWIIEDNAPFRSNLAETLNETPNIQATRDFSTCEEAIEYLPKAARLPKLILMDLSLPGMSGIEGIEHIKAIYPDIRFIVLTGSDQQKDVFNAISKGASGYQLKNTGIDQIISGIQDVMAGGASLDPHVASMILGAFPKSNGKKNANRNSTTTPEEYDLTDREIEALELLAEGKSIKEISSILHLSPHTIKFHVANTYKKLNVQSQAAAVAKGIRKGII
ncbi:MAG: response regulator [Akkermansiaceae bacterium]